MDHEYVVTLYNNRAVFSLNKGETITRRIMSNSLVNYDSPLITTGSN